MTLNWKDLFLVLGLLTVCDAAEKIHFSRKLFGHVFKTEINKSLKDCMDLCNVKPECKSINYKRQFLLCELNNANLKDGGEELTTTVGYVYQEKSSAAISSCGSVTACQKGSTCNSQDVCEITECPSVPKVSNGVVLGNMNSVGSHIVIECNSGFTMVSGSNRIECSSSGKWLGIEKVRCEMVCPALSQIELTTITEAKINTTSGIREYNSDIFGNYPDAILNGSEVTYECEFNLGVGGLQKIYCIRGTWMKTKCVLFCLKPSQIEGASITEAKINTFTGLQVNNTDILINSHLAVLNGSEITYKCDSGRMMNGSPTIYCINGTWSASPTCKYTYTNSCSSNDSCAEPGLICLYGICRCLLGVSYSYTERKCVDRCKDNLMANTFQETPGKSIVGNNADWFGWISNEDCKQKCIQETAFVCKGYELTLGFSGRCLLQSIDSVVGVFEEDSSWNHYQRDCK